MHILVVEDGQGHGQPPYEPLAQALRRELPESRVSEFVFSADLPDRISDGRDYDIAVLGCPPPHGRALLDRLRGRLGDLPWVILDGATDGYGEQSATGEATGGSGAPVYYLPPDRRALVVVLRQQAEILRLQRQRAAAEAARRAVEERFQVDAALISGYTMTLAQLSATEERLLAQYEHLPVPTYTWRREGTDFVLVNFNDAAKVFAGPNLRKLLNRPATEVFADTPAIFEDIALAYAERRTVHREMVHTMRSSGARRHLAVTYAYVPPDEVLVHTEDITARVEAEAALAYQAHLLANVNDAMVATDAWGRITSWNRAAVEMYGWPAAEALGRPVNEVLPAQWLGTDEQALARILADTGRLRADAHVVARDARELIVETTVMTLRDEAGQVTGYVSVGRDITLRRKAEAERDATLAALSLREASLEQALDALRRSEALLRNVLDTLPVGVWILDRGGHLLSANPAGTRIWAGQRDVPLERFNEVQGWRLDTGEPLQADEWAAARALLGGQAVLGQEIAIAALDGVRKIVSNSSVPLRDGDGAVIGAIVVQQDITERKHAESERSRMLDALRQNAGRFEALHNIDRAILAAQSPADIARIAAEQLRPALGCQRVSVGLFDPAAERTELVAVDASGAARAEAGTAGPVEWYDLARQAQNGGVGGTEALAAAARHALPSLAPIAQALQAEGLHFYVTLPLRASGELLGAVTLWAEQAGTFTSDNITFAEQVADSLAVALHNARLLEAVKLAHEQLQELSRRLVSVQEDERRAVARELYDQAGQLLTTLMLGLGSLERAGNGPPEMPARVAELKGMTEEIMGVLHRLAVDLRPASLDKLGLMPALRQYLDAFAARTGLQVELAPLEAAQGRLPADVETALYRIVQEALTNVVQHAGAAHVGVAFHRRDDRVIAIVEDDGQGFNAAAGRRNGRLGLLGMRERAEMLGGTLSVESAPGAGTALFVEIPVA